MRLAWMSIVSSLLVVAGALAEEAPASVALTEADVPGNLAAGKVLTFQPETLYQAINGQAELYLAYNFRLLTQTRFSPPGGTYEGFDAEVYEMASPLDAYGIFASSRSSRAQPVEVGAQGLMGTTQLIFYQGAFFVKVRSVQPRSQPEMLAAIGRAVARILPPDTAVPAECDLVRVEGVSEETMVYLTRPGLGIGMLSRGVQADVTRDSRRFTVANAFFDSTEDALAALHKYEKGLAETPAQCGWAQTALGEVFVLREPEAKRALFYPMGAHVATVSGPDATLDAGMALLRDLAVRQHRFDRGIAAVPGQEEPLTLVLPKPQFTGTPRDMVTPNLEPLDIMAGAQIMVPAGLANVALNKPVTASVFAPGHGKLAQVTDGDKEALGGSYIELPEGAQYVQIDLDAVYEIHAVVVWHYHLQPQVYFDVIVQISKEPDFILDFTTVFNNDHDGSIGLEIGHNKEYIETYHGKAMDVDGVQGRYVRLYSNGNTADQFNHYIEVEVYGRAL